MGLASSVLRVSSLTALSRVAGFVRTIFFATLFGSSALFDAFVVAFKIPNLFRRLFSEGAINTSIIPILGSMKKGPNRSQFVRNLFGLYLLGLGVFVGLGILFSPQIIDLFYLAQGNPDAATTSAATAYLRMMFGYLLFISFAALCQGALNTEERFAVPAATPILFNLILILCCVLAWQLETNAFYRLVWVSFGVLLGGVVQFAVQIPSLRRQGYSVLPSFGWRRNPDLRRFLKLMVPVVVASGTYQLNMFLLDPIALSLEEGTVSILHYSNRLLELPLGVVGISLTTVGLPLLSKHLARRNDEAFRALLQRLVRTALFVMVPVVAVSVMEARTIVRLLFEGGVFGSNEVQRTSACFVAHAVGLPAIAVGRIIATALISMQLTKPLMQITLASVVANLSTALLLTKVYNFSATGLAASGSVSAFVGMLLSGGLLLRKTRLRNEAAAIVRMAVRTSLAALLSWLGLAWLSFDLESLFPSQPNLLVQKGLLLVRLGLGLLAFATLYLLAFWGLGTTLFRPRRKNK